jgi:hypothetical protein
MIAHVAQSAEHFLGKEEVTGSIPVVGFEFGRPEQTKPIGSHGGLEAREVVSNERFDWNGLR